MPSLEMVFAVEVLLLLLSLLGPAGGETEGEGDGDVPFSREGRFASA